MTGLTVEQFSRLTHREKARAVVAWLRQERLMAPYVLAEIEKVVETLPSGSLSLAVSRGRLFEDRGARRGKRGRRLYA